MQATRGYTAPMTDPRLPAFPEPAYRIDIALIDQVVAAIAPHIVRTPLLPSPALTGRCRRPVWLKCETAQHTGSFKLRGALARLLTLDDAARRRGVLVASVGNHGLGVAWACRQLGLRGSVVVPRSVSPLKKHKLEALQVELIIHGLGFDEAEAHARALATERGATFVSAFDDPVVIAGNGGTIGQEIREQLPAVAAVVVPVGGGGLASGVATALAPLPVVGVNTAASPAMARSLAEGVVFKTYPFAPTLAEGLEGGVSANTAALCQRLLHSMRVVDETAIADAIRFAWQTHGLAIEGSAAVGIALLLAGETLPGGDGPLVVVVSGGNIDPALLQSIVDGPPAAPNRRQP